MGWIWDGQRINTGGYGMDTGCIRDRMDMGWTGDKYRWIWNGFQLHKGWIWDGYWIIWYEV